MNKLIHALLLASLACGVATELPTQTAIPRQNEVESTSVVSENLYLRTLPNADAPSIVIMGEGEDFKIQYCRNGWAYGAYIRETGNTLAYHLGYANKSYISGDCPNQIER